MPTNHIVVWKPGETGIPRQRQSKHFSAATNQHATIEERPETLLIVDPEAVLIHHSVYLTKLYCHVLGVWL
jgi:hypothetical protein